MNMVDLAPPGTWEAEGIAQERPQVLEEGLQRESPKYDNQKTKAKPSQQEHRLNPKPLLENRKTLLPQVISMNIVDLAPPVLFSFEFSEEEVHHLVPHMT